MSERRVAALVVVAGPTAGATVFVSSEVTIGRAERPGGVSFESDAKMAPRHARFARFVSGAVMVTDLGSGSGTWVGGRPITLPTLLQVGDRVQMGVTVVRFDDAFAELPATAGDTGGGVVDDSLVTLRSMPALPREAVPGGPVPSRPHRAFPVVMSAAVVALAILAFVVGLVVGGHGRSSGAGVAEEAAQLGTVYLESGGNRPGTNAILAYRYRTGGDLQPLAVQEYPTGGSAGFDLDNTGALDADSQIVVSSARHLLFAVNQGSDTIAVFHILAGGTLRAVTGSPFPSGGTAPGGLGVSGDRLVVVNKAQDGVRDLAAATPDVTTFTVEANGTLRPTGSVVTLPRSTSPTEALITPDGKVVIVPEEHGPLVSLTLSPAGTLAEAPGSPYRLPSALFPTGFVVSDEWVLGLSAQPHGDVLYAQVVNTAQLAVYQFDDSGRLTFVRAVADPGAYLPCWSLLNASGSRLYTDNAGNNTMSVFDLSDPLHPRQLQVAMLKNAGTPWDLRMDPSGRFVFVLDPRDRADLVPAGSGNELHTLMVNSDGTLSEPSYSPVPIPVPLNTNPIGLAVSGS